MWASQAHSVAHLPWRGGLCLVNGSATWGGSVVQDDDGDFHMFAAMMTCNETLQAWLTNSVVLHAVSSGRPEGPYVPTDISLAPRAVPHFDSVMIHNPDAKRAPDGQYVLFYDGSSKPPAAPAARGVNDVGAPRPPKRCALREASVSSRARAWLELLFRANGSSPRAAASRFPQRGVPSESERRRYRCHR